MEPAGSVGLPFFQAAVAVVFGLEPAPFGIAAFQFEPVVVGIVVRLLLGAALVNVATFAGALAAAVVGAMFSTVVAVFGARLWVALTGKDVVGKTDPVGARPA